MECPAKELRGNRERGTEGRGMSMEIESEKGIKAQRAQERQGRGRWVQAERKYVDQVQARAACYLSSVFAILFLDIRCIIP